MLVHKVKKSSTGRVVLILVKKHKLFANGMRFGAIVAHKDQKLEDIQNEYPEGKNVSEEFAFGKQNEAGFYDVLAL